MNYNLHAKVADFGLAARMYMRNNYNEQIGANMDTFPFRCSAYEILRTGAAIKEKSDVWSFGVLMWEIFYLGEALPYVSIAGLPELVIFLETGQRLEKPPLCPQGLYELMLWCWNQHYRFRPTFFEIKRDLKKFQTSQQQLVINSEMNSDNEHDHHENSDQTNPNQSHAIIIVSNPAYDLETIEQS